MTAPGSPPTGPFAVVPGAGWVDLISRVIVTVGFPVVVAGVLLWFLLTRFQDNMNVITSRMAANTDVAAKLIQAEERAMGELHGQTQELQAQTNELRAQTGQLNDQSKAIAQIAQDARTLADVRTQELSILRELGRPKP
jgi:hypothetical protein